MDTTFLEDHESLAMVHLVLKGMGCDPSICEVSEGGPLLVASQLEEGGAHVGAYDFNCLETSENELTYLFRTTLGVMDGNTFVSLLNFCNLVNARLFPPGTLCLVQEDESKEWFLTLRFTFLTIGAAHEMYEYIEKYIHQVDEFFTQARWAFYEVATGGNIEDGLEMLSIGETYAQA